MSTLCYNPHCYPLVLPLARLGHFTHAPGDWITLLPGTLSSRQVLEDPTPWLVAVSWHFLHNSGEFSGSKEWCSRSAGISNLHWLLIIGREGQCQDDDHDKSVTTCSLDREGFTFRWAESLFQKFLPKLTFNELPMFNQFAPSGGGWRSFFNDILNTLFWWRSGATTLCGGAFKRKRRAHSDGSSLRGAWYGKNDVNLIYGEYFINTSL